MRQTGTEAAWSRVRFEGIYRYKTITSEKMFCFTSAQIRTLELQMAGTTLYCWKVAMELSERNEVPPGYMLRDPKI